MEQLSDSQQRIIAHQQGHMLVIAGPGSGKTRVIVERIAYLLNKGLATSEQILVMTFTNKAAKELEDRLAQVNAPTHGLWVGTFHQICGRLLRKNGTVIDWSPPIIVCDEIRQGSLLRQAAQTIGWVIEQEKELKGIKDVISKRKRLGLSADQQRGQEPFDTDTILSIDEVYRRLLQEQHLLDYDDLILKGIAILQDEDSATIFRNQFQYVFVDEFHDLSPEQFELLRLFAPAASPQQVMVVADPNQSIYGWRQADATRMLREYCRLYRPRKYRLEENYRSVGNIVRAACSLINAGGGDSQAVEMIDDGFAIDCSCRESQEDEAEWLARLIQLARDHSYLYKDIAILYRYHKRADLLETKLLQAGIPLHRVQKNRFFQDSEVQSMLRYLSLIAGLKDESFETALNWPRVLVDEVTMVFLRRLAATQRCSLSILAQRIDTFATVVSPLTRVIIKDFLATVGQELLKVADQPINNIVDQLLVSLERRRSPLPTQVRTELLGVLDFLAQPLRAAADQLYAALREKRQIVVQHDGAVDSLAATRILCYVLEHYFQYPVMVQPLEMPAPAGACVITCSQAKIARPDGIALHIRDARTIRYSVSTQAWRLGLLLLMRCEHLRNGKFVLFDLETTSTHVNSTEILEIAALEIQKGQPTGRDIYSLVRPESKHSLSNEASQVNGITWNDVKDAPKPEAILPQFVDFLGNNTLVGHNIAQFDYPVVRRVANAFACPMPKHLLIDTFTLARRLLPGESHRLTDLVQRFEIPAEQNHRAMDDVKLNVKVFEKLLDVMDQERELEALNAVLPLVALGIAASGVPVRDENAWLMEAGARAYHSAMGADILAQIEPMIGVNGQLQGALQQVMTFPINSYEEDQRWNALRERWRTFLAIYCATFSDHSLNGFLSYAALAEMVDSPIEDDGRVTMMTIHTSKGMEWPLVFILGIEDGALPFYHAKSPEEVEEERRLLYVAMTRAKERLIMTWAKGMDGRSQKVSRFLDDVPDGLIKRHPSNR